VFDSLSTHNKERILKIEGSIRRNIHSIKRRTYDIGKLLFEAKKILPHGQFQLWIEQAFGGELPYSTAAAFKAIYDFFQDKPKMVRYIPVSILLLMKQKEFPEEMMKRIEADPEGFAKVVDVEGFKKAYKKIKKKIAKSGADLKSSMINEWYDNRRAWEEKLRVGNIQRTYYGALTDIKKAILAMRDYSDVDYIVCFDPLHRDQWFPPISKYVNDEIDDIFRMLHELQDSLNKPSPDRKPITVIGLPETKGDLVLPHDQPEPLQIEMTSTI